LVLAVVAVLVELATLLCLEIQVALQCLTVSFHSVAVAVAVILVAVLLVEVVAVVVEMVVRLVRELQMKVSMVAQVKPIVRVVAVAVLVKQATPMRLVSAVMEFRHL
jgi:hypothetical protein